MIYPTGLIHNYVANTWHPVTFRPAPLPSGADEESGCMRYRSKAHHTKGFLTRDEAVGWIKGQEESLSFLEGLEFYWDGNGIPALTTWIPTKHET